IAVVGKEMSKPTSMEIFAPIFALSVCVRNQTNKMVQKHSMHEDISIVNIEKRDIIRERKILQATTGSWAYTDLLAKAKYTAVYLIYLKYLIAQSPPAIHTNLFTNPRMFYIMPQMITGFTNPRIFLSFYM
ncbi:hypothetical protein ACJX0J_013160, partial [Zea mays]